jgi:hypothetical protein
MILPRSILPGVIFCLVAACGPRLAAAEETVATAVSSRVGNGYKRDRLKDGSFKPEFFALANGGRVAGTTGDTTVDRITYPEVATIAMRLLASQNYRYASRKEDASLLIVLYWGRTIAFNGTSYAEQVTQVGNSLANLNASTGDSGGGMDLAGAANAERSAREGAFEADLIRMEMENRARDQVNLPNAKLLGYLDEINDADDIRRWAGGGDRYNDLMADIEETRYYIIISAYDFPEIVKTGKKKLLWSTRVSVRAPGNRFDDSIMAMMKSAGKYFGQDSGRLVRGEESKGTVELGDLKFLGQAKDAPAADKTGEGK